ncbi:MAG: hypothetical protein CW742_09455 [Methanoregula sp.]|nr:MAG: hypothetical protein CW742_09455 [Methanoregula sp.]
MADLPGILDRVAQKVGDYIAGRIADKITMQDPSWEPLAESTIRQKKSSKAWVDTGEIFALISNTLQSVQVDGINPKMIQVGIFDHEKALIAQFLEYGTNGGSIVAGGRMHSWNHIPERPLFRLVFDEERENIANMIHTELGKEIDAYLVKYFG